jgi:RNA polymerase sigma factor (sigma-70 family)
VTPPLAGAGRARVPRPSLEVVLERFGPSLRRLVASYEHDPVEQQDLFQDICTALLGALPSFRGEAELRTFVLRVAHNRGATHGWRGGRRRRHETSLDDQQLDEHQLDGHQLDGPPAHGGQPSPEEAAIRADRSSRLQAAVRSLPLSLRQAVVLRLEGSSDREIAAVLGISPGAAAVRLTRARQRLADELRRLERTPESMLEMTGGSRR